MKKYLLALFLLFGSLSCLGQEPLPKVWMVKVDPVSGLFNEFRFVLEHKWKGKFFFYASPTFTYRSRLKFGQKHFGGGIRAGIRLYFYNKPPRGLFIQPAVVAHIERISFFNDSLQFTDKSIAISPGVHFSTGYQWLYGTKHNIVFGVLGGIEYVQTFTTGNRKPSEIAPSWYKMPFLPGLRLFAGFEVGFAFRQKNLHW